ncbi:RteC domain-containing protein [Mucilaginibacter corticis]|nr:RteC domain-containing protein [Mucilaginibacter corticis]
MNKPSSGYDIGELRTRLIAINEQINDLKVPVFENRDAEIQFYKVTKPNLYAQRIYEVEYFNILNNMPLGTLEIRKTYFHQELVFIIRFFRNHAFHYQYYRNNCTELDDRYFLKDSEPIPYRMDYLFAKFIAYEKIQYYLIEQLSEKPAVQKLVWTGDKVNLVELAYGIYHTHQIKAEVSDIVEALSNAFNITITGDAAYRMYTDIKRRKVISPTNYIDQMAATVRQQIEDSYSIKKTK